MIVFESDVIAEEVFGDKESQNSGFLFEILFGVSKIYI